jgi:hypothetical protein
MAIQPTEETKNSVWINLTTEKNLFSYFNHEEY